MKHWWKRILSLSAVLCLAVTMGAGAETKVKLDPGKPVTLNIWHYYNGMQQQVFDALVLDFNETVGAEQGIIVEAHSQGSVNDLTTKVMAAANHEVGAEEMPDVFAAYADTAYTVNQKGMVADLSQYMTAEEIAEYMDSYIHEGQLDEQGTLKVFPIAKSTELLLINATAWDEFAAATGADKAKLATWEGIVELAEQYYDWTDAKTPEVEGDGMAFFGRDAFANYMLIGSMQMGVEMFKVENGTMTLQVDETVMHRLWDNYYVPYVNGWFGAYGRFRSDDIKTGQLIALVGSTSGALYFPSEVTNEDGSTYPIACEAFVLPNFEGTQPYAVQQGAGLVVTTSTPEKEYAATVFLKWFTEADHNIAFAINSGYLPVKKAANDASLLSQYMDESGAGQLLRDILNVGVQVSGSYTLYTNNAFKNGYQARNVVEYNLPDAANAALDKRDELIAGGMSRAEAIAEVTGEDDFEAWLSGFKAALDAALAQ